MYNSNKLHENSYNKEAKKKEDVSSTNRKI
jgi:hypothetical protein